LISTEYQLFACNIFNRPFDCMGLLSYRVLLLSWRIRFFRLHDCQTMGSLHRRVCPLAQWFYFSSGVIILQLHSYLAR
jgi:hypothetical protein